MAVEFVTKDKNEAIVLVFGPCRSFASPYPALKLYGLLPDKRYNITYSKTVFEKDGGSFKMYGDGLMKCGIPEKDYTVGNMRSVMFHLKAE